MREPGDGGRFKRLELLHRPAAHAAGQPGIRVRDEPGGAQEDGKVYESFKRPRAADGGFSEIEFQVPGGVFQGPRRFRHAYEVRGEGKKLEENLLFS